jgi:hypothetical protein
MFAVTMTEAHFVEWLEGYKAAWERCDPDAAVRLFTDDVLYHETPFDTPIPGLDAVRTYWATQTGAQREVAFQYQPVSFSRTQGVARWQASFVRAPSGARVQLDGIFQLTFATDGRCRELREWWHRSEHPPR